MIKRNNKSINNYLERLGIFILLSNKNLNKKDIMSIYGQKDDIEKFLII